LEGNKAHGRIECHLAGNGGVTQRTRKRSKALKLAASRTSTSPLAGPTSVGPMGCSAATRGFGRGGVERPPSGGPPSPGYAATGGPMPGPAGGSIAPSTALLRHRVPRRGYARLRRSASADRWQQRSGDVGVRFGGSEHHRIVSPPRIPPDCLPREPAQWVSRPAPVGRGRVWREASANPHNRAVNGNSKKATAAVMRYGC
jgi:hypothetical protein